MSHFVRQSSAAFLLVLLVSLPSSTVTHACSCAPSEPPTVALERADAVFAGRVTSLEKLGGMRIDVMNMDPVKISFDLDRSWKGPAPKALMVITAPNGAICGYTFQIDEEYLVYAHALDADLWVSLCSRTAPVTLAGEDLAALGPGEAPWDDSGAEGAVDLALSAAILASLVPLAGVSVGVIVKLRAARRRT